MEIKSSLRNYRVQFQPSFSAALQEAVKTSGAFTLIDAKVYGLYKPVVDQHIKDRIFTVEAIEENKTYEKTGEIIRELLGAGLRRNSRLVVIGGGIVQDIGGFMASVLFRGMDYTLLPTTLLAQCDSCIGSKTSLNIGGFKNQLGTFYPPESVLVSFDVLKTLEIQDLHSGVCEAVKLAMLSGREAAGEIGSALNGKLGAEIIERIVRQALQIKKDFIENDEFDKGRRNLLNYGHTFGHGLESVSEYKIPHGIAVGLGIMAASYFSWKLNMLTDSEYKEARDLIRPWCSEFVPRLRGMSAEKLIIKMKSDKKSTSDQIGLILTRGFGKMERASLSFDECKSLLATWLQDAQV